MRYLKIVMLLLAVTVGLKRASYRYRSAVAMVDIITITTTW